MSTSISVQVPVPETAGSANVHWKVPNAAVPADSAGPSHRVTERRYRYDWMNANTWSTPVPASAVEMVTVTESPGAAVAGMETPRSVGGVVSRTGVVTITVPAE